MTRMSRGLVPLLVAVTQACAPTFTMRTLPATGGTTGTFIVPPGRPLDRFANGWSRTERFTPLPAVADSTIDIPLDDSLAPVVRVNAHRGRIAFHVPSGARLLPRDRTIQLIREGLHAGGITDAQVDSSGVARALERLIPREVRLSQSTGSSDAGLDPVDLRPGHRLRVERAGLTMSNAVSANWWKDKVMAGVGETVYTLTLTPTGYLSFEPAFAAMSYDVTSPVMNSSLGLRIVSIRADLEESGLRRRYWRIVYPAAWRGVSYFVPETESNAVLVGSDSARLLAGVSWDNVRTVCQESPTGNPYLCVIFAGRAALVAEVGVTIRGVSRYVPAGTTIRGVLESAFDFSQMSDGELTGALKRRLKLHRQHGTRRIGVHLDMHGTTWLDVRLQHGDAISW